MNRVEIFTSSGVVGLQNCINKWLDKNSSNIQVIDIKLSTAATDGDNVYSTLIFYKINNS